MIYGSVRPCTITWTDPLISPSIITVFIKTLSIHDLQEQFLLTVSEKKFPNPSTREKLNQLTKEKGIQDTMENTMVEVSRPVPLQQEPS